MKNIVILMTESLQKQLLGPDSLARLSKLGNVVRYTGEGKITADLARPLLKDAQIVLNSWGSPKFDADLLTGAPKLELVVYCAGSVKGFQTDALWERGIRVTSAAWAIGFRVAEYVLGMSIVGLRSANLFNNDMHVVGKELKGTNFKELRPDRELMGSTLGIISLGQVGRRVAEYLKPFGPILQAYDPFLTEAAAAELGVKKVDLDTLLRTSDVVTLHAPSLPETHHMIGAAQLASMKDGAVLINSSRGSVVDEAALATELRKGRISAILDVTDPEPVATDSPLRTLANCMLTPHLAGGKTLRIGLQGVEEVERYLQGRPQIFEVTKDKLATLA